jgi:hypothetical protein
MNQLACQTRFSLNKSRNTRHFVPFFAGIHSISPHIIAKIQTKACKLRVNCYTIWLMYGYGTDCGHNSISANISFQIQADIFQAVSMNRKLAAVVVFLGVMLTGTALFAQSPQTPNAKSQEVSETDGVPVIALHLPDWDSVKNRYSFATNSENLRNAVGDHPVLDLIDFSPGTEAVAADYPQGKLLIVEFTNPQSSADADAKILERLAEQPQDPPVIYRRIGNYNAFVFGTTDEAAANTLLDQIEYHKTIQWLGEDPFLLQKIQRAFVGTTRDIFISTVQVILGGILASMIAGIIAGFVYFRFRDRERARRIAFSDAGGLTRLNLDDLSEPILPK